MSRYLMCPTCGHRLNKIDDETYYCKWCGSEDFDDDDCGESLSAYDAALIWASSGKDEDYTFGYSEDELEDEL